MSETQTIVPSNSVKVCSTQIKIVSFVYVWNIENFSCCHQQNGEYIESPQFSAGTALNDKWSLMLYPRGSDSVRKNHIALFLRANSFQPEVSAKFEFSFLDINNEKKNSRAHTHKFTQNSCSAGWHFSKSILLLNKSRILDEDKLSILCELSVVIDFVTKEVSGQTEIPTCRLLKDINTLFEDHLLSDVVLSAQGRDFPAHKNILAARSSVFRGMFQHAMKEAKDSRVEIQDMESDVLALMLRFIYTGELSDFGDRADDLLAAADKYNLKRLKAICEKAVFTQICVENAAQTLFFADLHNASQLKANVLQFIKLNVLEVRETEGWKEMISTADHSTQRIKLLDELLALCAAALSISCNK